MAHTTVEINSMIKKKLLFNTNPSTINPPRNISFVVTFAYSLAPKVKNKTFAYSHELNSNQYQYRLEAFLF